jgi:multidrug resistance efflux pump
MHNAVTNLPSDLASCQAMILKQRAQLDELSAEFEKLRKLLSHFVNGSRSEKRILDGPGQDLLPFETQEEFEAAKAEAETEAKQIIEKYEVTTHERKKKRRSESLPADLPRVEVPVDVDDSLKHCPTHGQRTQIGEDISRQLHAWLRPCHHPESRCL